MEFRTTDIPGVVVTSLECHEDERGFFARSWCSKEFGAHGLPTVMVQANISFNRRAGTLRGLHFQLPPAREGKLVRCVRGTILDVVVDMRRESPTYLRNVTVELSDGNRLALYVPPGIAHGFQTLVDDTEVHYLMSDSYHPDLSSGIRWDDPALGITWPLPPTGMSGRDRTWPDLDPDGFDAFRGY